MRSFPGSVTVVPLAEDWSVTQSVPSWNDRMQWDFDTERAGSSTVTVASTPSASAGGPRPSRLVTRII